MVSPPFVLHPTLAADTVAVAEWGLARVLLMNDRQYPWLILVPARPGLRELHDLGDGEQAVLMAEITRASKALSALFAPDKINVAALGNVVPQLHVHVVARFATDPAWPGPVWGRVPVVPYEAAELEDRVRELCAALA